MSSSLAGRELFLCGHTLLWAASAPKRLAAKARGLLLAAENQLMFTSTSFWEISIKPSLGRADFNVDPRRLWRMLLVNGYRELPITREHTIADRFRRLAWPMLTM
jgi:PIN domain nuclease of toxin-antitoxin system